MGAIEALFMNCAIVIRTYNEEKHIGRLLEGLRQQTLKDVEIILVDSGSTDQTVSVAPAFGARIVRIPPAEFTLGRSLNFGVQAEAPELVVIANAHVYPVYLYEGLGYEITSLNTKNNGGRRLWIRSIRYHEYIVNSGCRFRSSL